MVKIVSVNLTPNTINTNKLIVILVLTLTANSNGKPENLATKGSFTYYVITKVEGWVSE